MIQLSTKTATLSLALAVTTLFSGCATTTNPEVRSAYDQTQQSLKSKPVSIISDGCLIRIENGNNDIMYQQSDSASRAIAQTVKSKLVEKGVKVNHISSPFICGARTKEILTKMDIILTDGAKEQPNTDYPILSATNTFDSVTNKAYQDLYKALIVSRKAASDDPTDYTDLLLDSKSLQIIKQIEGANKIFVVLADGAQPSVGARVATGAIGMLGMITGISNMDILVKSQDYGIYLINLDTNQLKWSKVGDIEGNIFKIPVDNSYILPKMLDPLYAE
ncbi:hypothetical protein [Psychrobacter glaciei]|uniref:hypothetical protein n=1 Tax=Psychrobacter glaciei TaxID=619771 RepID=UPI001F052E9B|nr:hypothetical protein [Psychrobacter glaciei]MCH1781385.1 hypothetical protein [Psychrobacter glaciei]